MHKLISEPLATDPSTKTSSPIESRIMKLIVFPRKNGHDCLGEPSETSPSIKMPGSFFVTSFRIPGVQITRPLCAAAGTDVLTSGMHEHLFNIMLATIVLSASWI